MKCQEKDNLGKMLLVICGRNFILGIYHQQIISWRVIIMAYIIKSVYCVLLFVRYHYYLYVRMVHYLVLIIYLGIPEAVCF